MNLTRSEAYWRRKIIKQYNLSAEQAATLDEAIPQSGYTYKEVAKLLEKLPAIIEAITEAIATFIKALTAAAQAFYKQAAELKELATLRAEETPKYHRQKDKYKPNAVTRNYKAPPQRRLFKTQNRG